MKTTMLGFFLIVMMFAVTMGVFTPKKVITPIGTRQVVIIDWVQGQCYLPYKGIK